MTALNRSFPKPDKRVRVSFAEHAENTQLFQNLSWGGLESGYRYLLFLTFRYTVTITDTTTAIVVPADILMRVINSIQANIPGMQNLKKPFTGEQWAWLHRLRGCMGNAYYNFSPNADLLLSNGVAQSGLLLAPIYVPNPYAPGFERCGLLADHLNKQCSIGVNTGNNSDADLGTSIAVEALTGTWEIWAYGYRGSKIIVAPKQEFDYMDLNTQGIDLMEKNNRLIMAAAYGTTNDDLVYPLGTIAGSERDQILVDGIDQNDVNDENQYIMLQRRAFQEQDFMDSRVKNYAATGIVEGTPVVNGIQPTTFPVDQWQPDSSLISSLHYIDNRNNLGNVPNPKTSLKVTPISTRSVMLERNYYHNEADLAYTERAAGRNIARWSKLGINYNDMRPFDPSENTIMPLVAGE